MGADDAADLAHQRLGKAEIVHQIGLDGVHLAGADGVTGQRRETGIDAAQLLDLLEEGDVCAGQTPGLAGHGDFALLDGDEGLDAQHPAGHGDGGGQTAALAQILQVVDGGDEVQVLLGVLEGGGDLDGGLAFIPQVCGHTHQQTLAEADIGAVHEEDVVHVGQVCGQLRTLIGAGQLMGQEDAHDLVSGGSSLGVELFEQLRAGLTGGGQLFAAGHVLVVLAGSQVHAVPDDGAVLEGDVEGDDVHTQLRGLGGQDVGCGIGKNAYHIVRTSMGAFIVCLW